MKTALYELTLCRLRALRREPSAIFFVFFLPIFILGGVYLITTYNNNHPNLNKILAISHQDVELFWSVLGEPSPNPVLKFTELFEPPSPFKVLVVDQAELTTMLHYKLIHGAIQLQQQAQPPQQPPLPQPTLTISYQLPNLTAPAIRPPTTHHYLNNHRHLQPTTAIEPQEVVLEFHAHLMEKVTQLQNPQLPKITHQLSESQPINHLIHSFLPAFFVFSLLTSTLFGMGMNLVMSRREGILKRFLTTPMNSLEYVLSHLISRQFLLFIEFILIIGLGYLLFDFRIQGSILLFFTVSMLATLMLSLMSFTLASRTSNTSTYSSIANFSVLICTLFSGVFPFTSSLPNWVQAITATLPLSPILTALSAIALEGSSIHQLTYEIGFIAGYTLLFATLSHYLFIWYDS